MRPYAKYSSANWFGLKRVLSRKYSGRRIIAVLLCLFLCACSGNKETENIESLEPVELDDTQFYIDGEIYTLPCLFSDLAVNGWVIADDQQTLGPNHLKTFEANNDDSRLGLRLENFTSNNAIPLEECHVMSVWQASQLAYPLDGEGAAIMVDTGYSLLVAGIRNGDSYDRMIELHGEPFSIREQTFYSHTACYPYMEITYNPLDGQINLVSIQSNRPDVTMEASVAGNVPDYIQQYRPPESFGEIGDREVFKMEGDFYRMPVPLSWFEKSGLKLTAHTWDKLVGAQEQLDITMESKNGVPLDVTIKNYMDTPQEVQSCVAISILGYNLEFELPGGINKSICCEDIIALYGRTNLRVDETHYIVSHGNQAEDLQVRFLFSNSFSEPMAGFHIRYYYNDLPLE